MIIICLVCIFSVLQKELSVSALQWQLDDLNCTHSKLKVLVRISALGILQVIPWYMNYVAMVELVTQYLVIRPWARVFHEQIVDEVQPSWLSLVENEGE